MRPEDVSTGLAPHKEAEDGSLRILWGLSPAAVSSEAAVSGPMQWVVSRAGSALGAQAAQPGVEIVDLNGERLAAPC